MKIDFGQMYGSYDKDQILSALRKDVLSALNSMYGNQLDAAVQKRFEQEWLAMEQSDTVLDVAALYEMTIWLKANSIPFWVLLAEIRCRPITVVRNAIKSDGIQGI